MDQFKEDTKRPSQADDANQLNLLRMIESRIVEIVQIEDEIKKKFPKLFQQRLPRFMRRRAASHNPLRVPRWLRTTKTTAKDRRRLFVYRRRIRFRKHKRILRRHAKHRFKNPNKIILHKWFAKRFKMNRTNGSPLEFVPIHNNTKNFRNLYRQTRSGCAYISMAHLTAIKVDASDTSIDALYSITKSISGFTFSARSLEKGHYEVVIHLYKPPPPVTSAPTGSGSESPEVRRNLDKSTPSRLCTHLCPALVSRESDTFFMWVPRECIDEIEQLIKQTTSLLCTRLEPKEAVRIRFVGPDARERAMSLAQKQDKHKEAIKDVDERLLPSRQFGATIGRIIREQHATFTYYQTQPLLVDVIFRSRRHGRMLWHQLIKNRAHLVGGLRDVHELLEKRYPSSFLLKPDCDH